MPGVQRLGDLNNKGGVIIFTNQLGVTANFLPVAVGMCPVTPHPKCPKVPIHCAALTVPILGMGVTAEFQTVVVTGDKDTCGDERILGSFDVTAGL